MKLADGNPFTVHGLEAATCIEIGVSFGAREDMSVCVTFMYL